MNNFPTKEQVARLRARYPEGARVELLRCDDPYTKIAPGTKGTVESVDDTGTVFVKFDSGSTLGMVYGVDEIRRLTAISDDVFNETMAVRSTGLVNMFDVQAVFALAVESGYGYLADFIFSNTAAYSKFILTAQREV